MHQPVQELSDERVSQIKAQLVDGCPGDWHYTHFYGLDVFELVDIEMVVDCTVEYERLDSGERFFLNMDAGPNYRTILNRKFENPYDAALAASPIVAAARRMMRELDQLVGLGAFAAGG